MNIIGASVPVLGNLVQSVPEKDVTIEVVTKPPGIVAEPLHFPYKLSELPIPYEVLHNYEVAVEDIAEILLDHLVLSD